MAKNTKPNVDPTPVVDTAPVAEIEQPSAEEVNVAVEKAVKSATPERKGFRKFADLGDNDANPYGITNSRGQVVTKGYLSRYIQCWCRKGDGYHKDRSANFAYFMSDEFLSQHADKTASQIGKAASIDPRWGLAPKPAKPDTNIATADPVAVNIPAPVEVEAEAVTE